MLEIHLKIQEVYNEETETFDFIQKSVRLEHSLLSVSKWEAKYERPFLKEKDDKKPEEILDYISMMVLDEDFKTEYLTYLTEKNIEEINDYISSKQSATWFNDTKKKNNSVTITSELIYYWMFSSGIPKECEEWHLNRLITLLRVFEAKNQPQKNMSKEDLVSQRNALNAQRKARMHSKG